MDSRGVSFTAPSDRDSARMYQDLVDCLSLTNSFLKSKTQRPTMHLYEKSRNDAPLPLSHIPKICVVGAGIAGLRCADILTQRGFHVTVIEARDRVGGRVHQTTLPSGHTVDLGPNWIHGTDNNPILDIAVRTGTATHDFKDPGNFFDENGQLLEDGQALSAVMWELIEEAFIFSRDNTDTIKSEANLYDWFKMKVDEKYPGDEEFGKRKILMQMIHFWGAFVASNVETQSLKFLWMEEVIEGENLFCPATYKKILEHIAKPALDGCKLMLSTKVTKVDTLENRISVWTDKGYSLKFDEVVCTAPLGWLKKNAASVFFPPLPQRLSQAINNIGYGNLEKVYITFPRAFWLGHKTTPNGDPFTGFVQWLAPLYAGTTNCEKWNQEAVDMSTMIGSHPTLLFYLFGDQVGVLSNKLKGLPDESRSNYLIEHFKPYYSLLPGFSDDSDDCTPTYALYTDWTSDDLAGNGSYTTMREGVEEADIDIEIMREGLPGRSLWFCGEHTAPFVAYGTVTGAYWSGEHVAERITKAYAASVEMTQTPAEKRDATRVVDGSAGMGADLLTIREGKSQS